MENRQKLREYGLCLIVFGICNLFIYISTIVRGLVDGSVAAELAAAGEDIRGIAIAVLIVIAVILAFLVGADIFLGLKGIKVSKKPDASKGHIVIAKIFLIISCIGAILYVISLVTGNGSALDAVVNLSTTVLSICIYNMFIPVAEAVRKEALAETK